MTESRGQSVVAQVPVVYEVAGVVVARAILSIHSRVQVRFEVAELKVVFLVHTERDDVLIESGPLAADVVACAEGVDSVFQSIVHEVAATVRQQTVGVSIAHAPVKIVVGEGVLAGELAVVCGAAAVVILRAALVVRLRTHSVTPCVTARCELVEDVLELVFVVTAARKEREIEHRSKAHIVVVLVVDGVTEVVGVIVQGIVDSEEIVLHSLVGAVFVGVIHCGEHAESVSSECPAAVKACRKFQVAEGFLGFQEPVVVKCVARERCRIVSHGTSVASQLRCEGGVHSAFEVSQTAVKTEKIGGGAFAVREILEHGGGVPVASNAYVGTVFGRYLLRVHDDKAARIVSGVFGSGRFHDGEVVYLRTRDDVEREGAGVGFAARHCSSVHPDIVVTL